MSKLSNTKLLSGKAPTIGPAADIFEGNGGITLAPEAYKGALAYSGAQIYYSDGDNWIAVEPADISTPKALNPSNSLQQRQMRLSGFSTTLPGVTQTGIIFSVSLNRNMEPSVQISVTSATANSYTLQLLTPIIIQPGQKFYWRAQYTATGNRVSPFSGVKEQQFPYYIDKPTSLTTPEIVTNFIKISNYNSAFGPSTNINANDDVTHSYTEWEAYTTNEAIAANRIFPTYQDTTKATSIDVSKPGFVPSNQVYYWRARNVGNNNTIGLVESPWSELFKQTQVDKILNPVILSATNVAVTQLVISAYASSDGSTLLRSLWEIYDSDKNLIAELERTGNTLQTEDILSIRPDLKRGDTTAYYWKARYLNVNGVYSQYTSISPSLFYIPYKINTPSSTIAENTVVNTLQITSHFSAYGLTNIRSEWQIYTSSDLNDPQNVPKLFTKPSAFSANFLDVVGAIGLKQGNTYYWRARYISSASIGGVEIPSEWSSLKAYRQAPSIKKPTIITPAMGSRNLIKGPKVTFTADSFTLAILGLYNEEHRSSIWVLTRYNSTADQFVLVESKTFTIGDTIIRNDGTEGNVNAADLTTWKTDVIENSRYKLKVQYKGLNDSSEFSDEIEFTTQIEFLDTIVAPEPISAVTTPYGTFMNGGYYAGKIWNRIAESDDSISLTKITGLNAADIEQTKLRSFTARDKVFNIKTDQSITPLFYINQMIEVRLKSDTTQRFRGYIKRAFGTQITVGVVETNFTGLGEDLVSYNGWHIMTLYNLFLAPKSEGTAVKDVWGTINNFLDVHIPAECFSLSEGKAATEALAKLPYTLKPTIGADVFFPLHISPAAIFASTANIGGKDDWYIPSRDELDLVMRLLNVIDYTTANNGNPYTFSTSTYIRQKYYDRIYNKFGELPDIDGEREGINRNAYIDDGIANIDLSTPYTSANYPRVNNKFTEYPAEHFDVVDRRVPDSLTTNTWATTTLADMRSSYIEQVVINGLVYSTSGIPASPHAHNEDFAFSGSRFRLIRRQLA